MIAFSWRRTQKGVVKYYIEKWTVKDFYSLVAGPVLKLIVLESVADLKFKGELNAKTNQFLFDSIGIVDSLCEVFFFN